MKKLGKLLIDNGVNIVFGHSAHHIAPIPFEFYKEGLIIYGLGDLINDYAIKKNYKSDESIMCLVEIKNNKLEPNKTKIIPVIRKFLNRTSIPYIWK